MNSERLALYTTIYPGVEKYLLPWYQSVQQQTDQSFDIWIGVDQLTVDQVKAIVGEDIVARWILADAGDTPATLREKVWQVIIEDYPAVIFVDSDDVLLPNRVKNARKALKTASLTGCAMQLIDQSDTDLNILFQPDLIGDMDSFLATTNIFGLSNTAYRTDLLSQCLPIPPDCQIVDWFLATKAWSLGAKFSFEPFIDMVYRQHPDNIARILPPFTQTQVQQATDLVLGHYQFVLTYIQTLSSAQRNLIENAQKRTISFKQSIANLKIFSNYIQALNQLPPEHIWWSCVAHPQLEDLWKN